MPLNEYLCESCGRKLEVIQRFADPPLATCDRCGGSVKKLLSSSAVQFKGSGWYVSDYRRSGGKEKEKDGVKAPESGEKAAGSEAKSGAVETPASKGTDAGSGTKSESKGAAPPSGAASSSKESGSGS